MHWVSSHSGKLLTSATKDESSSRKTFRTHMNVWDSIAPEKGWACGAIHELLHRSDDPSPVFVSVVMALFATDGVRMDTDKKEISRRSMQLNADEDPFYPRLSACIKGYSNLCPSVPHLWQIHSPIAICDPQKQIYPPGLVAMGVSLNRVYLIHPKSPADELWAMTESLRCRGVGVTIASPKRLDRTQARRLQLAAEQGGGIGIFLRPLDRNAEIYSALTRWLVTPVAGDRAIQKWRIQLLHGHGGQVGEAFILERNRETHLVCATAELSHRPLETNVRLASG